MQNSSSTSALNTDKSNSLKIEFPENIKLPVDEVKRKVLEQKELDKFKKHQKKLEILLINNKQENLTQIQKIKKDD